MPTSYARGLRAAGGLLGVVVSMWLAAAAPAAAATVPCSATNTRTGVTTPTLTAALAAALAGDTIDVRGTCAGNFTVTVPLTLDGAGPNVTLNAGGHGTVLAIDVPAGTVDIEFLKITGGSASDGGGIAVDGGAADPLTLDMTDDRVTGDTAAVAGGGLYAGSIGALNIVRCAFTNDSISPGANGAEGAAIVAGGQIDIDDSNIIGNRATAASAAAVHGGAMYLTGPATLDAEYVNQTTVSGGQIIGGGLDASSSLSLSDSQVAQNTATSTSGSGAVLGAGIYASGATLQITTTNIGRNLATSAGGPIEGAGIDLGAATPLGLTHSSVSGNHATSTAGAIIGVGIAGSGSTALSNTGVLDNVGDSVSGAVQGGGIAAGGPLTMTTGPVTGNSVSSSSGAAEGAGIWSAVSATLQTVVVSGNTASTAGGGVFNVAGPLTIADSSLTGDSAPSGAAIDNSGGSVSITHSLVTGTCLGCG